MLDIKYIRDNRDAIAKAARDKRIDCDVARLIEIDRDRRSLQQQIEELRAEVNDSGQRIGLMRNRKDPWYKEAVAEGKSDDEIAAAATALQNRLAEIKPRLKDFEESERPILEEFDRLMLLVPQPPDPEVPIGEDETQNVELRTVGDVPSFGFSPKDHVTLGRELGIIDIERGVKLSGARNYVLKGDGALLHQAVLRLAQDMMVARGFVPMVVPVRTSWSPIR